MTVEITSTGELHTSCTICQSSFYSALIRYNHAYLVKCKSCGFVFCVKKPSFAELKGHYKNYSYASEQFESSITKIRYFELLDQFEPYRKTNRILDDGCGTGFFLAAAKERGWEVYGSEFSEKAVEICEQRGIRMIKGDLEENSFAADYFDVITSFEVVEHLIFPGKKVEKIHQFLRPEGLFYCTTPNFNSLSRRILKEKWSVIGYPEHLSYFTISTLSGLLRGKGFEELKVETTGISISRLKKTFDNKEPIKGNASSDEKIRLAVEKKTWMAVVKKLVNGLLNVFRAGDTLKHWSVKLPSES